MCRDVQIAYKGKSHAVNLTILRGILVRSRELESLRPLIKKMLYRLSYEAHIFRFTDTAELYYHTRAKKQEESAKKCLSEAHDPAGRVSVPFIKASYTVTSLGRGYSGGNFLFTNGARNSTIKNRTNCPGPYAAGLLIGGCFIMKISRRSVLHISGLVAAALALTGCSAAGSAALGGKLPGLLKGLAKKRGDRASSEAPATWPSPRRPRANRSSRPCPSMTPTSSPAPRAAPTAARWLMVNNIANSQRQNARPSGHRQRRPAHRGQGRGRHHLPVRRVQRRRQHPRGRPPPLGPRPVPESLMPWNILYYHDGESIFCTSSSAVRLLRAEHRRQELFQDPDPPLRLSPQ